MATVPPIVKLGQRVLRNASRNNYLCAIRLFQGLDLCPMILASDFPPRCCDRQVKLHVDDPDVECQC